MIAVAAVASETVGTTAMTTVAVIVTILAIATATATAAAAVAGAGVTPMTVRVSL